MRVTLNVCNRVRGRVRIISTTLFHFGTCDIEICCTLSWNSDIYYNYIAGECCLGSDLSFNNLCRPFASHFKHACTQLPNNLYSTSLRVRDPMCIIETYNETNMDKSTRRNNADTRRGHYNMSWSPMLFAIVSYVRLSSAHNTSPLNVRLGKHVLDNNIITIALVGVNDTHTFISVTWAEEIGNLLYMCQLHRVQCWQTNQCARTDG